MNKDFSRQNLLNIKWQLPQPVYLNPTHFQSITGDFWESELDKALGWPSGTFAIIESAFAKELGRSCGWLEKDPKPAFTQAAKVYKRGVYVGEKSTNDRRLVDKSTYPIQIQHAVNLDHRSTKDSFFVVDSEVEKAWSEKLPKNRYTIEALETQKNLKTAAELSKKMQQNKAKHISIVGGGIVSDIAAFCAANLNLPFTMIPTTLLSMADACIGGKTGVNHNPYGKNQIGLFAFPDQVLIFTEWLESLPKRHLKSGIAECVKHALISNDEKLLQALSEARSIADLTKLMPSVIQVKAQIVSRDPYEAGERATLNLGHTFAHAIETISQLQLKDHILHGEAVGFGLLFAASLSQSLGHLSQEKFELIFQNLKTSQIDLSEAKFNSHFSEAPDFDLIWQQILRDKKATSQSLSEWVLLGDKGIAINDDKFTHSVDHNTVKSTYQNFVKNLL